MRGHVAEIFRTSEPRQRPGPAPELRPDELIGTSRWTCGTPVGAAIWDVSPARAAATAATALDYDGIRTLGQLASMTYEDLRRVPRWAKAACESSARCWISGMPNSRPPHALARSALATVPQRD